MNHKGHISILMLCSFITFLIGFSVGNMSSEYRIYFRIPLETMVGFIIVFLIFVSVGFHIAKNIYSSSIKGGGE